MAVFNSWMGNKAVEYRRIERITGLKGTAVNVQAMVFGNTGNNSGTGVAFTRDPNTGEDEFYGDYLINAQGEDVVAGIRTPEPISQLERRDAQGLRAVAGHPQEARVALQGDAGHRVHGPGWHALHAPDPNRQADRHGGRADRRRDGQGRADRRNDGDQAGQPREPEPPAPAAARSQGRQTVKPVAQGIAASPGAACGKVVLSAEAAIEQARRSIPDDPILLVRKETSPEDVAGHAPGQGDLDGHRRQGEPRGGRRPGLGQAVRRRLRGDQDRRDGRHRSRSTARPSRRATSSRSTARPATS